MDDEKRPRSFSVCSWPWSLSAFTVTSGGSQFYVPSILFLRGVATTLSVTAEPRHLPPPLRQRHEISLSSFWRSRGICLRNWICPDLFCEMFCSFADCSVRTLWTLTTKNWISLRPLCTRSLRITLEVLTSLCVLFMSLTSLAICESRFACYLGVSFRSLFADGCLLSPYFP